jgi:hypothetical protein
MGPSLLSANGSARPPPGALGAIPPPEAGPTTSGARQPRLRLGRNRWIYVGVVVTLAIAVSISALVENARLSHGPPQPDVIIPADTLTSISVGQYFGYDFVAGSMEVLNASYSAQYGILFYLMTPEEYQILVTTYNVTGYAWTAGGSHFINQAYLDVDVPPGPWVFAMANPNATFATAVGWLTALTLAPS